METSPLTSVDLSPFGLNQKNISLLDERTTVVKKFNWDYKEAHEFQKFSVNFLDSHPRHRILIACNHPRVLTNGRGLQKPRKGEELSVLKDFKKEDYPHLPYPLHQIERGGGLTFHHEGQFIFYPILKLNPKTLSLSKIVDDIFDSAIETLSPLGIEGLDHSHKLLGLWYGDRKMASMGIAIQKLTTFHGMALNVFKDPEMMKALSILNPCGMTSETYIAADEIIDPKLLSLEAFSDRFLGRIAHAWK